MSVFRMNVWNKTAVTSTEYLQFTSVGRRAVPHCPCRAAAANLRRRLASPRLAVAVRWVSLAWPVN